MPTKTTGTKKTEPKSSAPALDASEFLTAEFEYIAQTAFQAHEDRARVSAFYLVSVGSLLGAIFGTQISAVTAPYYAAFATLFLLLSGFGVLTLLQLIRLRQAWYDSAKAMNHIKDFYVKHANALHLDKAFLWTADSLPRLNKPWSISFMLALQVALLDAVTLGAAILYAGLAVNYLLTIGAILGGLAFFAAQLYLFHRLLR
ncbi:MAG: hypothetical protein GXP40_00020 [Chloroflexi bacterium]|nr:hypothetical protein [Chloroflexota bacterium]